MSNKIDVSVYAPAGNTAECQIQITSCQSSASLTRTEIGALRKLLADAENKMISHNGRVMQKGFP